jgi:hypothetical protein
MILSPLISIPQHQVNVTDAGDQQDSAIADIGSGRYIVVYEHAGNATLTDFDPRWQTRDPVDAVTVSASIDSGANRQFELI